MNIISICYEIEDLTSKCCFDGYFESKRLTCCFWIRVVMAYRLKPVLLSSPLPQLLLIAQKNCWQRCCRYQWDGATEMIVVYRCRCGETSRVVERRCSSWWILLLSVRSWCRGGSRLENKAVHARRETPTACSRRLLVWEVVRDAARGDRLLVGL